MPWAVCNVSPFIIIHYVIAFLLPFCHLPVCAVLLLFLKCFACLPKEVLFKKNYYCWSFTHPHVIQDIHVFLSLVENKLRFLMKTFKHFLHIMDFNGNQTVQGPNESFSAASKGFKWHQMMNNINWNITTLSVRCCTLNDLLKIDTVFKEEKAQLIWNVSYQHDFLCLGGKTYTIF